MEGPSLDSPLDDEEEVPIVSRRKKKRIVEDDESVDLSLSPKTENEPSPEDDEIINMIKQITGGTFAFHSPQWDSISEASKGLIRRCLTVEVRYFCVHIRLVCRHAGMHASI